MKFYLKTYSSNEFDNSAPDYVVAEVSDELFRRMRALQEEVKRLGVDEICFADVTIDWTHGLNEENEPLNAAEALGLDSLGVEIERCEVRHNGFRWTCYLDGASDQLSTDLVYFDALADHEKLPSEQA